MGKTAWYFLLLGLTTILWPSHGKCMDPPEAKSPPMKTLQASRLQTSQLITPQDLPRSYELLLILYGHSEPYVNPLKKCPDMTPWKQAHNARYEEYKRAYKDHSRAKIAHEKHNNQESRDKLKQATGTFQSVLRTTLRRHGSIAAIHKVQQIEEALTGFDKETGFYELIEDNIDNDLINTNLSELFGEEIKKIELLIFATPTPSRTKTKPPLFPRCRLAPTEIKSSLRQLKKLISWTTREAKIQEEVILTYQRDFLPEVSSWWSMEQWSNWLYNNKPEEVKIKIKNDIENLYPFHEYRLRLISAYPLIIDPRELLIYLKSGEIYFKLQENDAFKVTIDEKKGKTTPAGLGPKIFARLKNTLSAQDNNFLSMEEQWHCLNFASICGYLPQDYSIEKMSRIKRERKAILANLLDKPLWSWEWRAGQ